jgi:hypothetical protein
VSKQGWLGNLPSASSGLKKCPFTSSGSNKGKPWFLSDYPVLRAVYR